MQKKWQQNLLLTYSAELKLFKFLFKTTAQNFTLKTVHFDFLISQRLRWNYRLNYYNNIENNYNKAIF